MPSFASALRRLYDLENNQAALAQAKLNSTDQSITAIPSGTEIPGCTRTATAGVGGPTGSMAAGTGTIVSVPSATDTASATGSAPTGPASGTSSAAQLGSIGLGLVGIVAIILSL